MTHTITLTDEQEAALNFVATRDGDTVDNKLIDALLRGVGSFVYDMNQANFQTFLGAKGTDTKAQILTTTIQANTPVLIQ